jgi:mannose-1-phosphate guanylyltransferase
MNNHTWAVILAGGEGLRLRSLTQMVCGDNRPKQFCPIFGGRTLLGQTRHRLSNAVSPERTMFVVVKAHERYYEHELADVAASRIVVQPHNKGTAAAIVYSLLRILQQDEEAIVGYFPADHYFEPDSRFARVTESAFDIAARNPESLVLLGAEPHHPETEYGWIEPGEEIRASGDCAKVGRFWEKPSLELAERLLERGCLWNTFVMAGRAKAFLNLLAASVPELLQAFEPIESTAPGRAETKKVRRIYRSLTPFDFSHDVLSTCADRLLLLRLSDVRWNDLGRPERVIATLAQAGVHPEWVIARQLSFGADRVQLQ